MFSFLGKIILDNIYTIMICLAVTASLDIILFYEEIPFDLGWIFLLILGICIYLCILKGLEISIRREEESLGLFVETLEV